MSEGCTERMKFVVSNGAPGDDVNGEMTESTDSRRSIALEDAVPPSPSGSAVPIGVRSSSGAVEV